MTRHNGWELIAVDRRKLGGLVLGQGERGDGVVRTGPAHLKGTGRSSNR